MAFYAEDTKAEFQPSPSKTMSYSSNYSNADRASPSFSPQIIRNESPSREFYRRPPTLIKSELVSPRREPRDAHDDRPAPLSRHLVFKSPSETVFVRPNPEPSRVEREPPLFVMCKKEPVTTRPQLDKNSEFSLVTSKIAALSRKQPTPTKIKLNERIPTEKETAHARYSGRPRQSRRRSESEGSSCGIPEDVVTIETLSLQSLATDDTEQHNNPLVFHREPFDPSKVEIGQNLYVVQVDRTDAISVTSSL